MTTAAMIVIKEATETATIVSIAQRGRESFCSSSLRASTVAFSAKFVIPEDIVFNRAPGVGFDNVPDVGNPVVDVVSDAGDPMVDIVPDVGDPMADHVGNPVVAIAPNSGDPVADIVPEAVDPAVDAACKM